MKLGSYKFVSFGNEGLIV